MSIEPGAAVSLHLPPEALRVLRPSESATEQAGIEEETLKVQAPDEPQPAPVPPGPRRSSAARSSRIGHEQRVVRARQPLVQVGARRRGT